MTVRAGDPALGVGRPEGYMGPHATCGRDDAWACDYIVCRCQACKGKKITANVWCAACHPEGPPIKKGVARG